MFYINRLLITLQLSGTSTRIATYRHWDCNGTPSKINLNFPSIKLIKSEQFRSAQFYQVHTYSTLWDSLTSHHNSEDLHVTVMAIKTGLRRSSSSKHAHSMTSFADTSERAYGACIYSRSTDSSDHHHVSLICAKSRVAPLKNLFLPRLELCTGVLVAQLTHKVLQSIKIDFENVCVMIGQTRPIIVDQIMFKKMDYVCNKQSLHHSRTTKS